MPILRIMALRCNRQEDLTCDDNTYITINDVKFYGPKSFDDGQTRRVNKDRRFTNRAEIKLIEVDDYDPNDYLGTHTVLREEAGQGEKKVNFSNHGASYDLWYEIIPDARYKTPKEIDELTTDAIDEDDGRRVKAPGRPEVYLVLDGKRCHIPTLDAFNRLFTGWNITEGNFDHIPFGPALSQDVELRAGNRKEGAKVYLYNQDEYRGVVNPDVMRKFDFDFEKVRWGRTIRGPYGKDITGYPSKDGSDG